MFVTKLLARRTAMTAGKRREISARAGNGTGDHQPQRTSATASSEEERLRRGRLPNSWAKNRAKVPFIDTFDLRYKNYENGLSPPAAW